MFWKIKDKKVDKMKLYYYYYYYLFTVFLKKKMYTSIEFYISVGLYHLFV